VGTREVLPFVAVVLQSRNKLKTGARLWAIIQFSAPKAVKYQMNHEPAHRAEDPGHETGHSLWESIASPQ
jgi:hypothetical protein